MFQEPHLYNLSILDNIRFGRTDVTKDEVVIAAKKVNAFEFIMKLPRRFDTIVGEKGIQLSSGQRQRIALGKTLIAMLSRLVCFHSARAIVRNPSILLLDDATSVLDGDCGSVVQESLEKIKYGRTTIIVTKRLSSIKNVNKIIVLNKGRVEEEGSHTQLMDKHGTYFNLFTKQQKFYKTTDKDLTLDSISEKPETVEVTEAEEKEVLNDIIGLEPDASSELVSPDEVIREIAETDKEDFRNYPWRKMLKMNLPDLHYILLGVANSVFMAIVIPMVVIIIGNMFADTNKWLVVVIKILCFGLMGASAMFLQVITKYKFNMNLSEGYFRFSCSASPARDLWRD